MRVADGSLVVQDDDPGRLAGLGVAPFEARLFGEDAPRSGGQLRDPGGDLHQFRARGAEGQKPRFGRTNGMNTARAILIHGPSSEQLIHGVEQSIVAVFEN